ncbi:hypothetical protein FGB62_102g013 [Gracilaria domingensis]|nr:hypothetical protein FGB62_102g013 [Gracilaria domingensis]
MYSTHSGSESVVQSYAQQSVPLFLPRQTPEDVGDAAKPAWLFFKSLKDESLPIYSDISNPTPAIEKLSYSVKKMLEYCTRNTLSLQQAEGVYELASSIEEPVPAEFRRVTTQFTTAASFSSYLLKSRKWKVRQEGWRKAIIHSQMGSNSTGVFRSVLAVMSRVLEQHNGVRSIRKFREKKISGERVFSSPWDSEALKQYEEALGDPDCSVVLVDLYSDSTTLSSSGTQSATNVRVRFSNIEGASADWHEVGIVPVIDTSSLTISVAKIRKEKHELWHRFMFLLLEDITRASHVGIDIEGKKVYPRLGIQVADQVQERPSCGLKGHDSFFDCSHCLMPSRLKKVPKEHISSARNGNNDSDNRSAASLASATTASSNDQEQKSTEGSLRSLRKINTGTEIYSYRDVYRTTMAQIEVAKSRRWKPVREVQQNIASKPNLEPEILYLDSVSALQYPSALASFSGSSSFPYRLYASIGFDALHVLEHGVTRHVTDDAFKIFEHAVEYSGLSKSVAASIANQRILDLPPSSHLRKFLAFRKNSEEKHPGETGKMRRELNAYRWYAIMGLSPSTTPDKDRFLQLLLQLDLLQRRLFGINQCPEQACRSTKQIQGIGQLGYEVGVGIAKLFNIKTNTKMHRTMFYIANHLFDFGCIRKGSTDSNETMHKSTKESYSSTNRQRSALPAQLLSARENLDVEAHDVQRKLAKTSELITRNTGRLLQSDRCGHETGSDENGESSQLTVHWHRQALRYISHVNSIHLAHKEISEAMNPITNVRVWNIVKSARFNARFDWCSVVMPETVYAGANVFGVRRRNDAVVFQDVDGHSHGIIHSIFHPRGQQSTKLALVKVLHHVPGEE